MTTIKEIIALCEHITSCLTQVLFTVTAKWATKVP